MRITGISDISFRAGFSAWPSLDLNHTIEWPLQGTVLLSYLWDVAGAPGDLLRLWLQPFSPHPGELGPGASALSSPGPGNTGTIYLPG